MDHLARFRPLDRVFFDAAAELLDRHSATRAGRAWITSRDHLVAAIDTLPWVPVSLDGTDTLGLQRPLCTATRAAVQYLRDTLGLTEFRAIAPDATVPSRHAFARPSTYPLYGVEAQQDGQPKRVYLVDRGTPQSPDYQLVAEDLIPAGPTSGWPRETQRFRRGHCFYPGRQLHAAGATDHVPTTDKVIREHYFVGNAHWWIVEAETGEPDATGSPQSARAFGYACLGDPDLAEWGYVDLCELETLSLDGGLAIVERDLCFNPARAQDLDLPGRR